MVNCCSDLKLKNFHQGSAALSWWGGGEVWPKNGLFQGSKCVQTERHHCLQVPIDRLPGCCCCNCPPGYWKGLKTFLSCQKRERERERERKTLQGQNESFRRLMEMPKLTTALADSTNRCLHGVRVLWPNASQFWLCRSSGILLFEDPPSKSDWKTINNLNYQTSGSDQEREIPNSLVRSPLKVYHNQAPLDTHLVF